MRVDDKEFVQGLESARGRFDGLKSAVGTGVRAIATGFAAAVTTVGGLGAAAFKVGADFNILQQNSRAALASILGSAEAAADQMDRLDEFASNSPFARQVWITAQQQLLGFGVQAEKVVPALDAIQQAVAAMGGSNETISNVTYALAQMQAQGKLSGETLRDLGVYGIDAATIIGEQMGKSGQEIRDMATKPGGIPVEQVWDPLVTGLTERFEGATEGLRQQWDGAVDRIKAAWRDIGAILAEPFIDPMGGGRAVDWANDFADTLRAAQAKIRPFVDLLVERFAPGMDRIAPLFKAAQDAINSWDLSKVNRQLDELGNYTPLIAGLSTYLFTLGTSSLPIVGGAINPVVAGFAALAATSPEVRSMLGEFARSLQPLVPVLSDFGVLLADTAMVVLRELSPAIGDLLAAGGDLAVTLGGALVPALGDLLVEATPLVGILADIVSWVADLPAPVQMAGLAFLALQGPLRPVADGLRSAGEAMVRFVQQAQVQAALGETNVAMGGIAAASARAAAGVRGLSSALRAAFLTNPIGWAIAGVTTALSLFVTSQAEAKREAEELRATLDEQTGALTENSSAWAAKVAQDKGWLDIAEQIGASTQDVTDAMLGNEEAAARVQAAIDGVTKSTDEFGVATYTAADGTRVYQTDLLKLEEGIASTSERTREQQERQRQLAGAQRDAGAAADEHRQAQEELRKEIEEGIDATLSAAEAQLRMQDSLARATDAVERKREADAELERVLADATSTEEERTAAQRAAEQATRDADRAILGYTRDIDNHIAAIGRNNASYQEMRAEMARARESFIEQRIQMGDTRAEAEALADAYGLVPNRIDTMVHLSGVQEALAQIGNLDRTLNSINGKRVTASVAVRQYGQAAIAAGGLVGDYAAALGYADGGTPRRVSGQVHGPGSTVGDLVPAWLSPIEYVQPAHAVQKYGVAFMDAVRAGRFPVELAKPFAVGGPVAGSSSGVHAAPAVAPNVTVYVQNPWTGEQVRAVVQDVAVGQIREREWQLEAFGGQP